MNLYTLAQLALRGWRWLRRRRPTVADLFPAAPTGKRKASLFARFLMALEEWLIAKGVRRRPVVTVSLSAGPPARDVADQLRARAQEDAAQGVFDPPRSPPVPVKTGVWRWLRDLLMEPDTHETLNRVALESALTALQRQRERADQAEAGAAAMREALEKNRGLLQGSDSFEAALATDAGECFLKRLQWAETNRNPHVGPLVARVERAEEDLLKASAALQSVRSDFVDRAVAVLNEALKISPEAVTDLVRHHVACRDGLKDHPTIQVLLADDSKPTVGMLGLINGILGLNTEGFGQVTAVLDDDGSGLVVTTFQRSVPANRGALGVSPDPLQDLAARVDLAEQEAAAMKMRALDAEAELTKTRDILHAAEARPASAFALALELAAAKKNAAGLTARLEEIEAGAAAMREALDRFTPGWGDGVVETAAERESLRQEGREAALASDAGKEILERYLEAVARADLAEADLRADPTRTLRVEVKSTPPEEIREEFAAALKARLDEEIGLSLMSGESFISGQNLLDRLHRAERLSSPELARAMDVLARTPGCIGKECPVFPRVGDGPCEKHSVLQAWAAAGWAHAGDLLRSYGEAGLLELAGKSLVEWFGPPVQIPLPRSRGELFKPADLPLQSKMAECPGTWGRLLPAEARGS